MKSSIMNTIKVTLSIFCFVAISIVYSNAFAKQNTFEKIKPCIKICSIDSVYSNPFFSTFFQPNNLYGMGEATHGTEEFTKVRCDIFKRMCEQYSDSINCLFFMEAGYSEVLLIDNFIHSNINNDSTSKHLLKKLGYWTWYNKSLNDLILFCKTHKNKNKIHVIGADMQFGDAATKNLIHFFSNNNYSLDSLNLILNKIDIEFNNGTLTRKKSYIYYNLLAKYKDVIEKISCTESLDKKLALYNYNALIQYLELKKGRDIKYDNIRDYYMAQNILLFNRIYKHNIAIFFAHNGHISYRTNERLSSYKNAGFLLKENLKENYTAIGTDFKKGSYIGYNNHKHGLSVYISDSLKRKNHIMNLIPHYNTNTFYQINKQFTKNIICTDIGGDGRNRRQTWKIKLKDCYDFLIFYNQTYPTKTYMKLK
ncbi:MAG: hypothetical protein RJA07_1460 [Bacteroidota bacterium]|jgi:erythromycin esterase